MIKTVVKINCDCDDCNMGIDVISMASTTTAEAMLKAEEIGWDIMDSKKCRCPSCAGKWSSWKSEASV